jgi:glycosyltransferase involved in cell wall biosynthesis
LRGQDAKAGNKYVQRIKPRGEELIALSDFLAMNFFRNYNIRPAAIIENAVDAKAFEKVDQQRTVDILGAGSLIPLKQYDIFIEVIKVIKKIFPAVKAVIAGKGPEENHLRTLIQRYQLKDTIFLAGELSHEATIHLMHTSRIFIHTSSYEGFSGVCLEALAAGCPVISFIKPMQLDIPRWNIVKDKEEMLEKLIQFMREPEAPVAVIPFTMQESVEKVMRLFAG